MILGLIKTSSTYTCNLFAKILEVEANADLILLNDTLLLQILYFLDPLLFLLKELTEITHIEYQGLFLCPKYYPES